MSLTVRIDAPGRSPVESRVDARPLDAWTTQDMITAAERMRAAAEGDADWQWGYERTAEGVVITVRVADGTTIQSEPLGVPEVVVPSGEPPHWFGG